jgi:hypothetical protein
MAVLKHPNIDWNNGTTAPESIAELVALTSIQPLLVENGPVTLPRRILLVRRFDPE